MATRQTNNIAIFITIVVILIEIAGCSSKPSQHQNDEVAQVPTFEQGGGFGMTESLGFQTKNTKDASDADTGGYASGTGFAINWATRNDDGASVRNVLRAVSLRLQHLQSTTSGSDRKAKALFSVLKALDELEGTEEVSGVPLGSAGPQFDEG